MAQTKIANNQLQLDTNSFYTQDNLIAGKSIEIAEYVNPYVIDENTVGLWHFDESLASEIDSNSFTISGQASPYDTSYKKFGSASALLNKVYSLSSRIALGSYNWSIDFWIRTVSAGIMRIRLSKGSGTDTLIYLRRNGTSSGYHSRIGNTDITELPADNNFHHIAICKAASSSSNCYYFIDGVLKDTISFTPDSGIGFSEFDGYTGNNSDVDELRISNVCRWTEDFEVPDAPYEPASGSNPMVINTIVDTALSSTSKNPVQNKVINTALDGKQAALTTATGYDATKTQVLKNINGVLTWVDEA